MKLSAQEEYGLRCLLHMARCGDGESRSIPEISRAEGLSIPNVAKLMRLLRLGGMVQSVRGQAGGYTLARPADQITVSQVLNLLGGNFFSSHFCERHAGLEKECTHSTDCSLRQLWGTMQHLLDGVLSKTTLKDLLLTEQEMNGFLTTRKRLLFEIGNGAVAAPVELAEHAGVS
ncbi:MAG: Rrf2 family transcriptional regulator [Bryobacteraceae bacterium]|nr:Rrf2 family transcriptional regulator [Bryobacteraceae bacterium]